jgi:predicted TIM-barrel fold metal-dependent hydrolase
MDFIDTHQHLLYRDRLSYAWTARVPALAAGDFTLADYRDLTAGRGVAGSIFMEVDADDYQAEARLIAGLVGTQRLLGQIASCRPETELGFDAWMEECATLHVKGFRRILHEAPDDLSRSDIFRRNLRKIGAAGLPFDLVVLARQHPVAIDLLRNCPDQPFVLDHCGVPDVAGGGFASWSTSLRALAAFSNLSIKLSGIAAYCAPGTATHAAIKPYVDHVIDCFGPSRMVWGSDWPVVNLRSTLPDWLSMSRAMIADLSMDERSAIAHGNAKRLYHV